MFHHVLFFCPCFFVFAFLFFLPHFCLMDFFTSACSDYFSRDLVSVSPLPVSILGCYTFQPGSRALRVRSLEPRQAAQSSALRLSVLQHQDSNESIQSKAFCSRLIHATVAAWQLGCLCPSLHPQPRNLVDVWRYFLLAVGPYWQFWVAAMSEKKNWLHFWECGLIFFIFIWTMKASSWRLNRFILLAN